MLYRRACFAVADTSLVRRLLLSYRESLVGLAIAVFSFQARAIVRFRALLTAAFFRICLGIHNRRISDEVVAFHSACWNHVADSFQPEHARVAVFAGAAI